MNPSRPHVRLALASGLAALACASLLAAPARAQEPPAVPGAAPTSSVATPAPAPPGAAPAAPSATPAPAALTTPSPSELPPTEPEPAARPHARQELPLTLRGAIGVHSAAFADGGDDLAALALRLVASIPVSERVFLDARLPLGMGQRRGSEMVLGNIMLGAHATLPLGKTTWLSFGGAVGVPLLSGRTQSTTAAAAAQIPSMLWDIQEYSPSVVPMELRVGVEQVLSPLTLRAEIAPVVMPPLGRNDETEVVFLHAAEVQVGGAVAAGLRLQGVALPTFSELEYRSTAEGFAYQAALEPFLVVQKPAYFFRTGCMLPLSNPLGFSSTGFGAYGVRLAFGLHLD